MTAKVDYGASSGRLGRATRDQRNMVSLVFFVAAALCAVVFLDCVGLFHAGPWTPDGAPLHEIFALPGLPAGLSRIVLGGGAGLMGMLAIVLMLRRLGGIRSGPAAFIVASDEQGVVTVESEGICSIGAAAILRVPGILEVDVEVRTDKGRPLSLVARAQVYPGVDLLAAGNEAREAARTAIETLVGVPVHDVNLALEVLPPDSILGRVR